jgi:hypothetical protein
MLSYSSPSYYTVFTTSYDSTNEKTYLVISKVLLLIEVVTPQGDFGDFSGAKTHLMRREIWQFLPYLIFIL